MSETPERRAAKRIAIRLPVVFRAPDGSSSGGTTENISGRGMLIVGKEQPAGTRLRIAVTGPDGTQREVDARVVRSTPQGIAVSVDDRDAEQLEATLGPEAATGSD